MNKLRARGGFSGNERDEEKGNLPTVSKGNELGGESLSPLLLTTV